MRYGITSLVAATLLGLMPCLSAPAADGESPRRPPRQRPPTDVTVTGKCVKNVWKDKEGVTRVAFSIATPAGDSIAFSTGTRAEDGQPTNGQLDKFADKIITVMGKGVTVDQGEQTVLFIVSVTRILVIDPDAGK